MTLFLLFLSSTIEEKYKARTRLWRWWMKIQVLVWETVFLQFRSSPIFSWPEFTALLVLPGLFVIYKPVWLQQTHLLYLLFNTSSTKDFLLLIKTLLLSSYWLKQFLSKFLPLSLPKLFKRRQYRISSDLVDVQVHGPKDLHSSLRWLSLTHIPQRHPILLLDFRYLNLYRSNPPEYTFSPSDW